MINQSSVISRLKEGLKTYFSKYKYCLYVVGLVFLSHMGQVGFERNYVYYTTIYGGGGTGLNFEEFHSKVLSYVDPLMNLVEFTCYILFRAFLPVYLIFFSNFCHIFFCVSMVYDSAVSNYVSICFVFFMAKSLERIGYVSRYTYQTTKLPQDSDKFILFQYAHEFLGIFSIVLCSCLLNYIRVFFLIILIFQIINLFCIVYYFWQIEQISFFDVFKRKNIITMLIPLVVYMLLFGIISKESLTILYYYESSAIYVKWLFIVGFCLVVGGSLVYVLHGIYSKLNSKQISNINARLLFIAFVFFIEVWFTFVDNLIYKSIPAQVESCYNKFIFGIDLSNYYGLYLAFDDVFLFATIYFIYKIRDKLKNSFKRFSLAFLLIVVVKSIELLVMEGYPKQSKIPYIIYCLLNFFSENVAYMLCAVELLSISSDLFGDAYLDIVTNMTIVMLYNKDLLANMLGGLVIAFLFEDVGAIVNSNTPIFLGKQMVSNYLVHVLVLAALGVVLCGVGEYFFKKLKFTPTETE